MVPDKKEVEMLFNALVSLSDVKECEEFIYDLCTSVEIEEMSRRLKAPQMLSCGSPYTDVVSATGLSTTTISRVSRSLKSGNGYRSILTKLG